MRGEIILAGNSVSCLPAKCIGRGEGIERVLNWHTYLVAADPQRVSRVGEYVRTKWDRRQGAVPKSARIFEVSEKLHVLAADFAVERAVEILPVGCRNCRCEIREVKGLLFSRG